MMMKIIMQPHTISAETKATFYFFSVKDSKDFPIYLSSCFTSLYSQKIENLNMLFQQ